MSESFFSVANRIETVLCSLKQEPLPEDFTKRIDATFCRYEEIKARLIPRIESITQHPFDHQDLFLIVFLYKEISDLSNNVKQSISNGKIQIDLSPDTLSEMIHVKDTMETLAFIGDSALESGVIRSIWPPDGSILEKGTLNDEKKFITEGAMQADLWDVLLPEEKDRQSEVNAKSSQFEAVFAIIYLEGGLEAVENAILALKAHLNKTVRQ